MNQPAPAKYCPYCGKLLPISDYRPITCWKCGWQDLSTARGHGVLPVEPQPCNAYLGGPSDCRCILPTGHKGDCHAISPENLTDSELAAYAKPAVETVPIVPPQPDVFDWFGQKLLRCLMETATALEGYKEPFRSGGITALDELCFRMTGKNFDWEELNPAESIPVVPPTHPEDFCQECGHANAPWFVANELWNLVVPDRVGVLCPVCFIKRAKTAAIEFTGWELVPENLAHTTAPSSGVVPQGAEPITAALFWLNNEDDPRWANAPHGWNNHAVLAFAEAYHAAASQAENAELKRDLDVLNRVLTQGHSILDAAQIPVAMWAECNDPDCDSQLIHRLKELVKSRDQAREALRNIRLVARTCPDIVIARTIEEIADDALAAVPPSEDAPPQIGNMNIGLHEALQRGEFTVGAAGSDLLGEDAPATPQPVKECPNCGSKNPYFYGRNCIKNAVSWHRDNQKPAEPAAQPAGKEAPTKGALKAARAINQGLPVSILDQGVIKKFGVSEAAAEYEYRIAQIIDREMRPESLLKKEGLE